MTFDTLKYAETLREAGVDEKQAAAQAHALNDAMGEKVASKQQLGQVEQDLTTKIDQVESSLTTKIDKVESSLTAKIDKAETSLRSDIDRVEAVLSTEMNIIKGLSLAAVVGIFTMVVKTLFFP